MKLQASNRRPFNGELSEVIQTFYSAHELWELACDHLYTFRGITPPEKKPRKDELVELFMSLFSNKADLTAFLQSLPEKLFTALMVLTWNGDYDLELLEEKLGFQVAEIQEIDRGRHFYQEVKTVPMPWVHWFAFEDITARYYDAERRFVVRLPPAIRRVFRDSLPKPAGYYLEPLNALPEGMKTYRCDDTLAEDLRVVADFIQRGHLEYTKSEAIKRPCIRALEKMTDGREFFPAEKSSAKLPLLRHELLVNILASLGENLRTVMLQEPPDPEKLLRPLCSSIFRHPNWFYEYVLTHVSGAEVEEKSEAITYLKALFSRLSSEHWISMTNLELYVNYRDINLFPFSYYHPGFVNVEPFKSGYYTIKKMDVQTQSSWGLVIVPLLKGTAFLLAALGLAEVAYTLPPQHRRWTRKSEIFLTPYDGCFAIRLTPLGAYALNLTDEVELKVSQHARAEILLNPQRLTAICRNVDPITEMSLLEFMEKVSDGCYRMTRQTLLRGCASSAQVKKRVEQFKAQISSNLPELWEQFLDEVIQTAGALRADAAYTVYELADNPTLRRLFISDPTLSEKALKVEGMRVAIKKSDLTAVSRRLNALGYLMK